MIQQPVKPPLAAITQSVFLYMTSTAFHITVAHSSLQMVQGLLTFVGTAELLQHFILAEVWTSVTELLHNCF